MDHPQSYSSSQPFHPRNTHHNLPTFWLTHNVTRPFHPWNTHNLPTLSPVNLPRRFISITLHFTLWRLFLARGDRLKEKVTPETVYFLKSPKKDYTEVELLTVVLASKVHPIPLKFLSNKRAKIQHCAPPFWIVLSSMAACQWRQNVQRDQRSGNVGSKKWGLNN